MDELTMNSRNFLLAILISSLALCASGCGLAAIGVTGGAGVLLLLGDDDDEDPVIPDPDPLPTYNPGEAWVRTAEDAVAPGGTIVVSLYVESGNTATGSYSATLTYNDTDFTLKKVSRGRCPLKDPFLVDESTSGTVFISGMNSAEPQMDAQGELEVARLVFEATGTTGAQLNVTGQLLNLADTAYPAVDIGPQALPRTVTVETNVTITQN